MGKKTGLIISAISLAVLLAGASAAYTSMRQNETAEFVPETLPETIPETSIQNPPAPDFVMLNQDGEEVRLADFVGKPILVNFWATWCPPCREELPYFEKAYAEYQQDAVFLIVNETDGRRDTIGKAETFIQENNYSFPLYFDTQGSGAKAYSILSIPVTVLIDPDGGLAYQHIGALSETELFDMLERHIPKSEGG